MQTTNQILQNLNAEEKKNLLQSLVGELDFLALYQLYFKSRTGRETVSYPQGGQDFIARLSLHIDSKRTKPASVDKSADADTKGE